MYLLFENLFNTDWENISLILYLNNNINIFIKNNFIPFSAFIQVLEITN